MSLNSPTLPAMTPQAHAIASAPSTAPFMGTTLAVEVLVCFIVVVRARRVGIKFEGLSFLASFYSAFGKRSVVRSKKANK